MKMKPMSVAAGAMLVLGMSAAGYAADWNQYRGASRNGASQEKNLISKWEASGPKEVWRVAVGAGYSGISVVNNRVYTMDSDEKSEYALCADAATGKQLWRVRVGELFKNDFGDGPRSTPTVDGDLVYVLSSLGNLKALKTADGSEVWSVDFRKSYESPLLPWAFCASPLVVENQLIMEIGGKGPHAVGSFDKKTGKLLWSAQEDQIAYSSPILVEFNGVRQLVFMTKKELFALNLKGEKLWSEPFTPEIGIKPAMPVFLAPDLLFVSASYDAGCKVVRMAADGDSVKASTVWESKEMRNHFNTSVARDQYLYGFDKAMFKCLDSTTGKVMWVKRGLGKGSLITADKMAIALSERGKLHLAKLQPDAYEELASHQVLSGRCWTQPSLAEGRLYVRSNTEMVCLDLRK